MAAYFDFANRITILGYLNTGQGSASQSQVITKDAFGETMSKPGVNICALQSYPHVNGSVQTNGGTRSHQSYNVNINKVIDKCGCMSYF